MSGTTLRRTARSGPSALVACSTCPASTVAAASSRRQRGPWRRTATARGRLGHGRAGGGGAACAPFVAGGGLGAPAARIGDGAEDPLAPDPAPRFARIEQRRRAAVPPPAGEPPLERRYQR